jgi:hypothetical protein
MPTSVPTMAKDRTTPVIVFALSVVMMSLSLSSTLLWCGEGARVPLSES